MYLRTIAGIAALLVSILSFAQPVLAQGALSHVEAARKYILDNKLTAASKEIADAVKLDPTCAPAHDLSGLISELQGDTDAAEEAYRKAIDCDSAFIDARLHLGALLIVKDDLDGAVEEYKSLKEKKKDLPEAYCGLARALMLKEEYKKALTTLEEGEKEAVVTAEMCYLKGNAHVGIGPRHIKNAIDAFKKSVSLDAEYVDAYISLADIYIEEGKFSLSAENLIEALRYDPENAEANYLFGKVATMREQYGRAILAFKKTIETDPEYANAHLEIGILYQDYKKDFEKAIFHYNKYNSLDGSDARVKDWLQKAKDGETSGTQEEETEEGEPEDSDPSENGEGE